jgi:hypothetical protein
MYGLVLMILTTPYMLYYVIPLAPALYGAYRGYLRIQGREQAESALESWAALHGYQLVSQPDGSTPTLAADNGRSGPCFAVPVGEQSAALFEFSYTVGSGRDQVTVDTTIVQAPLAAGFPHFRVVPRNGRQLPPGPGDEREVELESIEFQRDHKLLAGQNGDRAALEQMFDPETIVWWINQGSLAPIVEYQMGTLVVRSILPLSDAGGYDMLLAQAQKIAGRVLAEGLLHQAS